MNTNHNNNRNIIDNHHHTRTTIQPATNNLLRLQPLTNKQYQLPPINLPKVNTTTAIKSGRPIAERNHSYRLQTFTYTRSQSTRLRLALERDQTGLRGQTSVRRDPRLSIRLELYWLTQRHWVPISFHCRHSPSQPGRFRPPGLAPSPVYRPPAAR